MVSLENKNKYKQGFVRNLKVSAFIDLLEERKIHIKSSSLTEIEIIYFECILSLQNESKENFHKQYKRISRRVPSGEQPFIYDDFLLFILTCCIRKFNIDKTWLLKVFECRKGVDDESKNLISTFRNILQDNFENRENHYQVVLVFQNILNLPLLSEQLLDDLYKSIVNTTFPAFKSEFLNLMSLKAFDLIILYKNVCDISEIKNLKEFEKIFLEQIKQLGSFLRYLTILIFLISLYLLYENVDFINQIVNKIGAFLGLLGIGLIGTISTKKLRMFYSNVSKKYFGYNK